MKQVFEHCGRLARPCLVVVSVALAVGCVAHPVNAQARAMKQQQAQEDQGGDVSQPTSQPVADSGNTNGPSPSAGTFTLKVTNHCSWELEIYAGHRCVGNSVPPNSTGTVEIPAGTCHLSYDNGPRIPDEDYEFLGPDHYTGTEEDGTFQAGYVYTRDIWPQ